MRLSFTWLLFSCVTIATFSGNISAQETVPATSDGIESALRLTATLHPTVKSKLDELRALGFDLESTEAQRFPTFTMQAQTMSSDKHQVAASLQQPLWVGGRIDGAIDQSNVKLNIGKASLLVVQRQLIENVAATYAVVQGARRRLNAAEINVQEHIKLRTIISRREQGGIASKADVLMATSRLSQAVSQQVQLNSVLLRNINDLNALTQVPIKAEESVPERFSELPVFDQIVFGVDKASATVQQRLFEVDLAKTAVTIANANMMPALYAKLEQDLYVADKNGTTPQETRIGLTVQGTLEGLGFSGWKRIKSSDSRVDAAKRDVETARNDARRQAQALLTDLQSLQKIQGHNEQLVSLTDETLASFLRQYDAGRKSWVDVLNTQRELSDARLGLEQTRSSLQETALRLAAQLGKLDSYAGVLK